MKIKKQGVLNYDPTIHAKEKRKGKDECIPQQGLSIRQLFEKYRVSGQVPGSVIREGFDQEIDERMDPEDLHDMEKVRMADDFDRHELYKVAEQQRRDAGEKLDAMKSAAKAKRAEKQAEYDAVVEELKKRKNDDQQGKSKESSK